MKKETGLGLSHKKDENFGEWYSEVLLQIFTFGCSVSDLMITFVLSSSLDV